MNKKYYYTAIAMIALFLPVPAWAAKTSTITVERQPCEVVIADDGTRMCKPPKVSSAPSSCIRVTVTQGGKFVKYIWVCEKPRTPKAEKPKPANEKPKGGY